MDGVPGSVGRVMGGIPEIGRILGSEGTVKGGVPGMVMGGRPGTTEGMVIGGRPGTMRGGARGNEGTVAGGSGVSGNCWRWRPARVT